MSSENPVSDDALREEVRAWLADNWDSKRADSMEGSNLNFGASDEFKAWVSEVVEARWAVPSWPAEWFGRGLPMSQSKIIAREFAKVRAPGSGQDRSSMWANTLLARGTEALKAKLLGPILKSEVDMCLLYSEPGSEYRRDPNRHRARCKADTCRLRSSGSVPVAWL